MTEHEKQEFWNALTRLYDETLALRDESLILRDEIRDLRQIAEAHQRVVERHQIVAVSHEKRLDRLDVLVEWLATRERRRETEDRPPNA